MKIGQIGNGHTVEVTDAGIKALGVEMGPVDARVLAGMLHIAADKVEALEREVESETKSRKAFQDIIRMARESGV